MTRMACTVSGEERLAWWLGELEGAAEQRFDEHLFSCSACAARLETLVALGAAIRGKLLSGDFGFVAPASFVGKMKDSGLVVREYTLEPGGSVNCTIAPEDDFVAAHLLAPLAGVQQLDVLIDNSTTGKQRLRDVAFDPANAGLTVIPSATFLRSLQRAQQRMQLVAVEGAQERVIGHYLFDHYPS